MTQPGTQQPPLNPDRTQWSDDGRTWWDGTAWIPGADVPARQAELEREAAARLREEQASYAARYAEWQSQQAVADPFAGPGTAGASPPPPPPGLVMEQGVVLVGPRATGYATGIWSFVCAAAGLILWGLGAIAAIVLGHVSRSQAKKAHLKPNVWSRLGLFFGYLQLALMVLVVALFAWLLSNPAATPVGVSLTRAGQAEEIYHRAYGTYADGIEGLAGTRYEPEPGVVVTVERASADDYCLRGQKGSTVYWLARGGKVTKASCR